MRSEMEDWEWCEERENDCSNGLGSSSNFDRIPGLGRMGGRWGLLSSGGCGGGGGSGSGGAAVLLGGDSTGSAKESECVAVCKYKGTFGYEAEAGGRAVSGGGRTRLMSRLSSKRKGETGERRSS